MTRHFITIPSPDAPFLKVAVFTDGRLAVDGTAATIHSLQASLRTLSEKNGVVWYYREAGQQEPPPIATDVINAVIEARLPVRLFSRPDYSDAIGSDGHATPRKPTAEPTKRRGPITLLMTSRRFRLAVGVLIAIPVLYVASFGPACWISSRTGTGSGAVSVVYQPMLRLCMRDTYFAAASWWYASIGTKDGIYTARDAERRIHVQWEPLRIDFISGISVGDQDPPPINDE